MTGSRGAFISNYVSENTGNTIFNSFKQDFYSNRYRIPSSTTITYEGLFSENYFRINQKEKYFLNNIEISSANIVNPLNNEKETWIGLQTKSKYDGIGIRKPIDIFLLFDTSGSMAGSRMKMAKSSVINFFSKIQEDDNIAIFDFNSNTKEIIPMTDGINFKKNLEENKNKINILKASGQTDLLEALRVAYENMEKDSKNEYKRIIFITDMEYEHNEQFIKLCEKSSNSNIFITILGISRNFNTKLAEDIAHMRGCNYYIINNEDDIKKYLIDEFNYTCFASSYDVNIKLFSPNLIIEKIIGTGHKNTEIKELNEYFPSQLSKYENESYKKNMKFLLLYFNRIGKTLPKPVLVNFSNFFKCERKLICNVNTTFPSALIEEDNKLYAEGGMILIKLKNDKILSNNYCQFLINYKGVDDNKVYSHYITYDLEKKDDIYYSDDNIRKALSLYYFAKFNRRYMKIANNENKNKKYYKDYLNSPKFLEDRDKIFNLLEKDFNENLPKYNKDNLFKKYHDKMKEMTDNVIKNREFNK